MKNKFNLNASIQSTHRVRAVRLANPTHKNIMKNLPRKAIYLLTGLGAIVAIGLTLRPSPLPVDLATVKRGNLVVTIDAEGKTRIRSRFIISAPVAGKLERIQLDEGDLVTKGEIIAQIDTLPLTTRIQELEAKIRQLQAQRQGIATMRPKQSAILQALAQIKAAQALKREADAEVLKANSTLEQSRRELQRFQKLQENGVYPEQELETAKLEEITLTKNLEIAQQKVDNANANVESTQKALSTLEAEQKDPDYLLDVYNAQIAATQAQIAKLQEDVSQTQIPSPATGRILRILEKNSRHVAAGTQILEVGNFSELEIVVNLLSKDAISVEPGDEMLISIGTHKLKAKVKYIEPSAFTKVSALGVEEQRVNVIANLPNTNIPLGDRYRVDTQIIISEQKNVLTIPLSSLFRCEQNWCVFVVEEGKIRETTLEIGQRNDLEAEVIRGLPEGKTIVLYPSEQIENGIKVTSRDSL
ncbi:MAG: efflux RND transporter periplasmic adaptor subunit [Pleurocapsa sp.]